MLEAGVLHLHVLNILDASLHKTRFISIKINCNIKYI